MNAIQINDITLPVVEYRGERVVTLTMIDQAHQRPEGTARRNFNENRSRFIEGEDFNELTADEIRTQSMGDAFPPRTPKGMVLTESGYLMLVKSFTDDLAWDVQRKLVKSYFGVKLKRAAKRGNPSLDAFRQARAMQIATSVASGICDRFPNLGKPAQQVIYAKLVNPVVGQEVVPLPVLECVTLNATAVGKKLGVHANTIGRIAIQHGLKTEEYGRWVLDKSRSSDKQVETFQYNEAGIARISELLPPKNAA